MWTLQVQVEGFSIELFYTGCSLGKTQSPQPLGPLAPAAPWPGWAVPGSLLSRRARQGHTEHAGRWAGSATPCSSAQAALQSLDLGLFLPLKQAAGLLLLWVEHCKPWRAGECAEPTWQHMHLSRDIQPLQGLFLSGRGPEFWSISGHKTPALNTRGSVHPAHLGCLRPVQFQT